MDKVNFADFQKLDIRIGTVVSAEVPEWSHWVMKLTVDLGEEIGERTIFAGIMHFYKPSCLLLLIWNPKKWGQREIIVRG